MKLSRALIGIMGGTLAFLLLLGMLDRHIQPARRVRQPRQLQPEVFPVAARAFNPPAPHSQKDPQEKEVRKQAAKTGESIAVGHEPTQPQSGQAVSLRARFKVPPAAGNELLLEYQIVEPGKYIALRDAAFQKQWTSIPMA